MAIFSVFSYLDYKNKEENYSQPNVLAVKSRECLVKISKILPQSLLMILTSENLNFCKVQRFLRHRVLNRKQHSEMFVHYLLFMFFFFHFEMENNGYCQRLLENGVLDNITENKMLFAPNCE